MPTDSNLRGLCFVESISLLMVSITSIQNCLVTSATEKHEVPLHLTLLASGCMHFSERGLCKEQSEHFLSQHIKSINQPHWKLQWQTIRVEPDNTPPTFYAFDKLHLQKDEITIWMILCSVSRGEDNWKSHYVWLLIVVLQTLLNQQSSLESQVESL